MFGLDDENAGIDSEDKEKIHLFSKKKFFNFKKEAYPIAQQLK